jgi:hypothetical protein
MRRAPGEAVAAGGGAVHREASLSGAPCAAVYLWWYHVVSACETRGEKELAGHIVRLASVCDCCMDRSRIVGNIVQHSS